MLIGAAVSFKAQSGVPRATTVGLPTGPNPCGEKIISRAPGATPFPVTRRCLSPSHHDRDRNTDYYPHIIHQTPTEPDRHITNVARGTSIWPREGEARPHKARRKVLP